jgi:hypothetical protein
MALMGISELVIIFALTVSFSDVTPARLNAPHDKAVEAVRYVLPDADVVFHGNIEGTLTNFFALLDELEKLGLVKNNPALAQGVADARKKVREALDAGAKELGIDFTKDLGSLTMSLALRGETDLGVLLRLRGKLEGSGLVEQILKDSGGTVDVKGGTLHLLKDAGIFPDTVFCLPDKTTLLIGHRPAVEQILAKGAVQGDSKSRQAVLRKKVDRKAGSFVFLSLPDWVLTAMSKDRDLVAVATFLGGIDSIFYSAGPRRGFLEVTAAKPEMATRVEYLFKAGAAALGTAAPMIDVATFGLLGVLPLIPEEELGTELMTLLKDEKGILELNGWLKKRFTGKAKVRADARKMTVSLTLDNPASVVAALLPAGVGAAWYAFVAPKYEEPLMEDPYGPAFQDAPRPAIEHLPVMQGE